MFQRPRVPRRESAYALILLSASIGIPTGCRSSPGGASPSQPSDGVKLESPVRVTESFELTRWGDSSRLEISVEAGPEYRPGDDDGQVLRVHYSPGEGAWAAIYWQARRETGVRPSIHVPNAAKVVFWVRGELGGESVLFKLPADPAIELLKAGEPTRLEPVWTKVELALEEGQLEGNLGVFGVKWNSRPGENPLGLTFFLDDIRLE